MRARSCRGALGAIEAKTTKRRSLPELTQLTTLIVLVHVPAPTDRDRRAARSCGQLTFPRDTAHLPCALHQDN